MKIIGTTTLLAALLIAPPPAAAASSCGRTALPLPAWGKAGQALVTDGQGGAGGFVTATDDSRHVVSWKNGVVTDFGTTVEGRTVNSVADENRSGTLVGRAMWGFPGPTSMIAFKTNGGKLEQLPAPAGVAFSEPVAISDNGDVYGTSSLTTGGQQVRKLLKWPADRPGTVVELTTLPSTVAVYDVADDGTAVLTDFAPGPVKLWRDGVTTTLGTLPGATSQLGYAISAGRVVGSSKRTTGGTTVSTGVLWDTDGVARPLAHTVEADTINRDGLLMSFTDTSRNQAWQLTEPGWTFDGLEFPNDVGDDGVAVGSYFTAANVQLPATWRCR